MIKYISVYMETVEVLSFLRDRWFHPNIKKRESGGSHDRTNETD